VDSASMADVAISDPSIFTIKLFYDAVATYGHVEDWIA
jgi:hypothetical protein